MALRSKTPPVASEATTRPTAVVGRRRLWGALASVSVLALVGSTFGCKSTSPSQYVSPRVVGRVLDSQTEQPITDVQVSRTSGNTSSESMEPAKGGQRLRQTPVVRTGADGAFELSSIRDLALFRTIGWYSVSVSFQCPGYEPFATNFSYSIATNTAAGEPVVNAGDILLIPAAK